MEELDLILKNQMPDVEEYSRQMDFASCTRNTVFKGANKISLVIPTL